MIIATAIPSLTGRMYRASLTGEQAVPVAPAEQPETPARTLYTLTWKADLVYELITEKAA